MSKTSKGTPIMTFYYSKSKSLTFEKLSQSNSVTEYITPTFDIYSDSSLKNKIGFMSQVYLINQQITLFNTSVVFTKFIGSFSYSHSQLTSANKNLKFVDTIIYGNGQLSGLMNGQVYTQLSSTSNVVKAEVCL